MSSKLILVPTNFSSKANIAFGQSVNFAQKIDDEICLLHIMPPLQDTQEAAEDVDAIHDRLIRLVEEYGGADMSKIHIRIESGKIIPTICKVASEVLPEYLFIGSDIEKTIRSITMKIIDRVDCPIVVFAGRFNRLGCLKIVLPLDLTKETMQKTDMALRIAKIYNSTVYVVSAISDEAPQTVIEKLTKQIGEVQKIFKKANVACETKLLPTKTGVEFMANAINDYADDIMADAIIIMTRQENKLQKFFVGSMATELIKKANAPILCVSPRDVNKK